MLTLKICTKCGEAKPTTEYFRDRRKANGHEARCKVCKRTAHREYLKRTDGHRKRYWTNPQAERERHLVRKYGVTLAGYDAMFAVQNGGCAVCGKRQDRAFDVDHDHTTGSVRGLLCTSCNRMIGHAGDSAERLEAGAAYLRLSRKRQPLSSKPSSNESLSPRQVHD